MQPARAHARPPALAALALALALVAGGCASGGSGGAAPATTVAGGASGRSSQSGGARPAPVAKPETYPVGSHSYTWVDRTRGTNANNGEPAKDSRTLPALVLYPAAGKPSKEAPVVDAPAADGRFPLILFSHGVTSQGPEYIRSLRALASAGYVVVAPTYPLSNRNTPGGATVIDEPNQAKGDVPFLLDQVEAIAKADGPLKGVVDTGRVGLAGHSLGAVTSLSAGYDPCCADGRVDAVAEWSGILVPLTRPFKVAKGAEHRPLLIVHGEEDHTVPFVSAEAAWQRLGTPKVQVSLPGQGHVPAFVVGEDTPVGKLVVDSTVDFFDQYLKGDQQGVDRIRDAVDAAGPDVATMRDDLD